MDETLYCESCSDIISEGSLCPSCEEETLAPCDECGGPTLCDELQEYHGTWLCGDCYGGHFTLCECCEEPFDPDHDSDAWGGMCSSCAEEHFVCDSCGRTYHNDDYGNDGACTNCYEDKESGPIKDYHSGPDCGHIFYPDETKALYFGVELETDDYGYRKGAAERLSAMSRHEELFWLEEDSSLCNGIEIISQPCTLDYHRDQFPWRKITDIVENYGGKAEKTSHAAMHVHFSKDFFRGEHSELYQLRLIYLFEKFYNELAVLGRSTNYLLDRSAQKYNTNLRSRSSKAKIRELRNGYGRYQAVNITNRDTIEIRIFRSTLITKTILASLELVDFLLRLAKKTSTKKLQEMTWKDLLSRIESQKYYYLPQYIKLISSQEAQL